MHVVLGLAGLLGGEAPPALPGLARLVAAGTPSPQDAGTVAQTLAVDYGVARAGDWPLAALRAAAFGLDCGGDWWLAADPVTLVAGRDDVRVAGPVVDLGAVDAAALVAALTAHFATDGVVFVAPTPQRWLLRRAHPAAIVTQPLARAIGAPLYELLPQGPDGPTWRRWGNEIEMLLHDHPVNRAREARGQASVNGVWFGDGGTLPARVPAQSGRVNFVDDDNELRALALHAGESPRPVPAGLADALAAAGGARQLVIAPSGRAAMSAIEAQWAAPMWRALASGALSAVTLVADGGGRAARWEIPRGGFFARQKARWSTPDLAALIARALAPR